jgi:transcriptional regulator with XRE-family HTH domain
MTQEFLEQPPKHFTLQSARKRVGMTQVRVADLMGVDPLTIANWEKNTAKVQLGSLVKLCQLYHINLTDLYIGKESDFIEQLQKGSTKSNGAES